MCDEQRETVKGPWLEVWNFLLGLALPGNLCDAYQPKSPLLHESPQVLEGHCLAGLAVKWEFEVVTGFVSCSLLLQLAWPPVSPSFQILLFLGHEVQICLGYHFQALNSRLLLHLFLCWYILGLLPTGLYKTNSSRQHNSSLLVLETRSPKSRYWQGRCLLGSLKESSCQLSFPCSGGWSPLGPSLGHALLQSAPLHCTWCSLCLSLCPLARTSTIAFGAQPNPDAFSI